jgi:hypothetical protein
MTGKGAAVPIPRLGWLVFDDGNFFHSRIIPLYDFFHWR